ncbi:MAG: hypothetical protein Unbinned5081contig1001_66 [Prokaryotic dsDNA virus sp.]|nr:MAG: hypothetical protein Unbinned5081contig1001_66 [Prokaryotic dsDNA virus sp.]
MTFFLQDQPDPYTPDTARSDIPDFIGGLSAAFSRAQLENNANFRSQRETNSQKKTLAAQVADRVGLDAITAYAREQNPYYDQFYGAPTSTEDLLNRYPNAEDMILPVARQMAEADPKAWSDIDLTDKGVEDAVNAKLKAEHDALTQTLSLMPQGQGAANILGGIAGVSIDAKNLPFLFAGGGSGAFLKVMGREAAINMAAEVAFLPDQYQMADRLDIADPKVLEQLAMAGAFGAGFGAVIEGLGRGITYSKLRNTTTPVINGVEDIKTAQIVSTVEDLMQSTDRPLPSLLRLSDEMRADRVGMADRQFVPLTEEEIANLDSPQARESQTEAERKAIDSEILERNPGMADKYPLARTFIPTRRKDADGNWETVGGPGFRYKIKDPKTGDMVLSPIAQELKVMGITPKTHPFIWRKDGVSNLDNIVANEFDGLDQVITVDPMTGYFDEEALITAIGRELATGEKTPLDGTIQGLMDLRDAPVRSPDAPTPDAPKEPKIFETDFEIDPSQYPDKSAIADDVYAWMRQNGYDNLLTADEIDGLIAQMQTDGGFPDDFVTRRWQDIIKRNDAEVKSQEAQYAEIPIQDPVSVRGNDGSPQGTMGPSGRPETGSLSQRGGPSGRGAGAGNDGGPLYEATSAGQQGLLGDTQPITQADRLQASADAPMSGGDAAADFGLFDVGGRSQRDMFSDPTSAEAKVFQDSIEADLRTEVAASDFDVDIGDGKGVRPVSEILDDIDGAQEWADVIQLCGRPQ